MLGPSLQNLVDSLSGISSLWFRFLEELACYTAVYVGAIIAFKQLPDLILCQKNPEFPSELSPENYPGPTKQLNLCSFTRIGVFNVDRHPPCISLTFWKSKLAFPKS